MKYADDLARLSLASVIRESGLHPSANVQIRHGMKLEKYVQIKSGDSAASEKPTEMTVEKAAAILRQMHRHDAPWGEKGVYVILFGLKYADDLARLSLASVIRESGIYPTANVEIRYGMKLAKYVHIKPDAGI